MSMSWAWIGATGIVVGEEEPYTDIELDLGLREGEWDWDWDWDWDVEGEGAAISSASAGEEGRTMTNGPLALLPNALRLGEALVLRLCAFRRGACCCESVKDWAVGDHEEGDVELWRLDGVMVELDWNVDMDGGEC